MNPFRQDSVTQEVASTSSAPAVHTHELAEILLGQLRTAFQSSTRIGAEAWGELLNRFRAKTAADTVFVFDERGLVIASTGGIDGDEEEAAAAKLAVAFGYTRGLDDVPAFSMSVRFGRRWLTVLSIEATDMEHLYLCALSNEPIEPALGPPDHIGRGRWNNFLSWALGSSPATEGFLMDQSALLVESTHEDRRLEHEVAGSRLVQLYEGLNKVLIGWGAPQVLVLRYPDDWLSSVRVRRSAKQILFAGVRGPLPVTAGRADDLRRSMWRFMSRSFVSDRAY